VGDDAAGLGGSRCLGGPDGAGLRRDATDSMAVKSGGVSWNWRWAMLQVEVFSGWECTAKCCQMEKICQRNSDRQRLQEILLGWGARRKNHDVINQANSLGDREE